MLAPLMALSLGCGGALAQPKSASLARENDDPRLQLQQQCANMVAKACTELRLGTKQ